MKYDITSRGPFEPFARLVAIDENNLIGPSSFSALYAVEQG
jgi:hypothetical protein